MRTAEDNQKLFYEELTNAIKSKNKAQIEELLSQARDDASLTDSPRAHLCQAFCGLFSQSPSTWWINNSLLIAYDRDIEQNRFFHHEFF